LLGVKLVRGAYLDKELARHTKAGVGTSCPVWAEKSETDACYNACAKLLVDELAQPYHVHGVPKRGSQGMMDSLLGRIRKSSVSNPGIGLLFGTHNDISCAYILEYLVDAGLAHKALDGKLVIRDGVEERLCFGQLYGTYFLCRCRSRS
jgi:proline dehydrogenase